eukprot:Nitzschia sp. Nitz4//scaffold128_size63911//47925//48794//NITZ4_006226-RA/size63911-processed-gene-0.19-mRNA-1//1//CDS//3329534853//5817//frame0
MVRSFATSANSEMDLEYLPFEPSSHRSATITIPEDDVRIFQREGFPERLQQTCSWLQTAHTITSVWVNVPMSRASWIEDMQDLGFRFHNAEGKVAQLNLWLGEGECKVPPYATTHVGVGALVVNKRDEVLLVRELRKNYFHWKVPGGLSEVGESIPEAAIREVLEETGIQTKFHSVLSFRHSHGHAHGRSDVFFMCRLDPVEETDADGNSVIPEPVPQEGEIETTEWVPMKEYRAMIEGWGDPSKGHPMMRDILKLYEAKVQIVPKVVRSLIPGRKPSPIYAPANTLED